MKLLPIDELASIAVDADYVYYAEVTGKVARVKKATTGSDAEPEVLATAQLSPRSLVVSGDYLYWVTQADGGLHRVRIRT